MHNKRYKHIFIIILYYFMQIFKFIIKVFYYSGFKNIIFYYQCNWFNYYSTYYYCKNAPLQNNFYSLGSIHFAEVYKPYILDSFNSVKKTLLGSLIFFSVSKLF